MRVIIINGSAESGKDTFVEIFTKLSNNKVRNLSTIDKVKEFMTELGWDGSKDEKSRQAMSDLKRIITDFNDGIFNDMIYRIKTLSKWHGYDTIFVHCREPEEIQKFVDHYGSDICKILLVTGRKSKKYNNDADKNVDNYNYDYIIKNDGSLDELNNKVKFFINWLKGY